MELSLGFAILMLGFAIQYRVKAMNRTARDIKQAEYNLNKARHHELLSMIADLRVELEELKSSKERS